VSAKRGEDLTRAERYRCLDDQVWDHTDRENRLRDMWKQGFGPDPLCQDWFSANS